MTEQEWLACIDPLAMIGFLDTPAECEGRPWSEWCFSERRLRLFACACVRRVWHLLTEPRSRKTVAAAERLTDEGRLTTDSPERQAASVRAYYGLEAIRDTRDDARRDAATAAWSLVGTMRAATCASTCVTDLSRHPRAGLSLPEMANYLRDLGSPYRRVTLPVECVWCGGQEFEPESEGALCAGCGGAMRRRYVTPQVLTLATAAYARVPRRCGVCARAASGFTLQGNLPGCGECHGEGTVEDGMLDREQLAVLSDAVEEAGCTDAEFLAHLRGPGPHIRGCWAVDLLLGRE